jgi:CheY-like chemotaxis protein
MSVLIVDDDASIRRLMRLILTDAGYDVMEAEDGAKALAIIEGAKAPSVLVLDLNMPVMDGWELFHRLQEDHMRPRTIIMTAGQSERTRKELGAEASLQKPFGPEDLVEKVDELAHAA